MSNFVNTLRQASAAFIKDEEGAQVVEYALIIAVVSVILVAALAGGNGSISDGFSSLVTKVNTCLTTGSCTVASGGGTGTGG